MTAYKNQLAALVLVAASMSIHAQAPSMGSTLEVISDEGVNGSALLSASLYPRPITRVESTAEIQSMNQAATTTSRQVCALDASELGGQKPRLFAYKLEVIDVREVRFQTRNDAAAGTYKSETWAHVVFRPRPTCTGWMRLTTAGRRSSTRSGG